MRKLLLAIEILSPSSGRHDRMTKRSGYQRHVADYWIVDNDSRLVERWHPGDERPEILSEVLNWHPQGAQSELRIELKEFFAKVHGES